MYDALSLWRGRGPENEGGDRAVRVVRCRCCHQSLFTKGLKEMDAIIIKLDGANMDIDLGFAVEEKEHDV